MSALDGPSGMPPAPAERAGTALTTAERRILDALDEQAMTALLVDLVRVPSVTGSDAESSLQHDLGRLLIAEGLDVDAWAVDLEALRADPQFPGSEAERTEAYGLVGVLPGRSAPDEPALVLQGHVDVVPVGDRTAWAHDPYGASVVGRVLHGRGACDMKAGVAVNLAVVRAVRCSGVVLERPLALHSVVGEEDGGLGAFATLRRGHGGAAAVITEPTSGRLVTAAAGALTFELAVPGLAAHGSTRREGHSAIDAYLPLHTALAALEARRNLDVDPRFTDHPLPYPISVGILRSGDWASTVPDTLVAQGRFGVRLGEDVHTARADFETAVADAARADPWLHEHPPVVTWPGGQFASGELAPGHPLAREVQQACLDTGGPAPRPAAAPYGSDLRLYAGIGGIPTLHYGPGDVRDAHSPHERVDLDEVVAVARALALLAARRCEAHL
ncbi:MAG: M20/M25/M40 family metallo-hydrolase [Lapillicoccus sp.]